MQIKKERKRILTTLTEHGPSCRLNIHSTGQKISAFYAL
jgi:hypothetical protein